jgi:aminoglycoside phosphotransferase (APT) family kinase protein
MNPLPDEIALALEHAGLRARRTQPLATIDAGASGRAVFKLELEDGRTLKARRLEDEASVRRLCAIRRELPAAFAPVVGSQGRVLLEAWIEGKPLDGCPSAEQLASAAALLAALHAREQLAGEPLHERRPTRDWRERSEADLALLLAAGAIDAGCAERARAGLERRDPQQAIFGLVHSDFCGENLLIDGEGKLRVIDNERLRIDALGFDVARTRYRWPLPPHAWRDFCLAYAAASPLSEPLEHVAFWELVVVVKSARLRLRIDPARVEAPLARLRALTSPGAGS